MEDRFLKSRVRSKLQGKKGNWERERKKRERKQQRWVIDIQSLVPRNGH